MASIMNLVGYKHLLVSLKKIELELKEKLKEINLYLPNIKNYNLKHHSMKLKYLKYNVKK